MFTPYSEWRILSGRIEGYLKALELHMATLRFGMGEGFVPSPYLAESFSSIFDSMAEFRTRFAPVLPKEAAAVLGNFSSWSRTAVNMEARGGSPFEPGAVLRHSVELAAIKSELDYHLRDQSLGLKSTAERAFRHLQRLVAVDCDVREKWKTAFNKGKTECEKMGAVHLLWHGVFAFKVNAEGQRTDLVYSEPPSLHVIHNTLGLVLTEWKKLQSQTQLDATIKKATQQAQRYTNEGLADIELRDHRYIVIVS